MAVAEPSHQKHPAGEECAHTAPTTGVMAHEFSPYQGAEGPEGARRTTMFYGPVVGGLAIQAWHCQECGLLKMSYPDGRQEERRLFPGPQPGLLAVESPADQTALLYGRQARVSGLTADPEYFARFEAAPPVPLLRRIGNRLPDLGAVAWLSILGLVVVAAGLLVAGYMAVNDVQTPAGEGPLVGLLAAVFGAVVVLQIGAATVRHLYPPGLLPPSVAVAQRGAPSIDATTRSALWLLGLSAAGLLVAAILAVYDYQTSSAEAPVFLLSTGFAVAALVIKIGHAIRGHFSAS